MSIEDDVVRLVQLLLARTDVPAAVRLTDARRVLSKFRAEQLEAELASDPEARVRRGPFRGMRYPRGWSQACHLPKLLGTYEAELHPVVQSFTARGYRTILNAGCAEGYYAVGLARAMPAAHVVAFDTDPEARQRCTELARLNAVEARVEVRGEITHADLQTERDSPTLLLCDIEGAEDALIDPNAAPALRSMDLLVEVHDIFVPGTGERLSARFAPSHDVQRILGGEHDSPALSEVVGRDQLDQLLTRWEGRLSGTYWLWMQSARKGA